MAGPALKNTPWTMAELQTLLCVTLSVCPTVVFVSQFRACWYDDPPTLKRYILDGNTTCLEPNQVVPH